MSNWLFQGNPKRYPVLDHLLPVRWTSTGPSRHLDEISAANAASGSAGSERRVRDGRMSWTARIGRADDEWIDGRSQRTGTLPNPRTENRRRPILGDLPAAGGFGTGAIIRQPGGEPDEANQCGVAPSNAWADSQTRPGDRDLQPMSPACVDNRRAGGGRCVQFVCTPPRRRHRLGCFELDQLLHHETHRAGSGSLHRRRERAEKFGQETIQSHRCVLLGLGGTPRITPMAHLTVDPPKPTTPRTIPSWRRPSLLERHITRVLCVSVASLLLQLLVASAVLTTGGSTSTSTRGRAAPATTDQTLRLLRSCLTHRLLRRVLKPRRFPL
jgi:hypothetical protein